MISSRLTRRGFCHAVILAVVPALRKNSLARLPLPEVKLGDRVRTERICDDRISPNYGGLDWECGFVIGYVWQWDEWLENEYRQGWTYWIRFDEASYEINCDRQWTYFVHESEVIQV